MKTSSEKQNSACKNNVTDQLAEEIEQHVIDNQWRNLKQFTSARIALGRAGNSIPTDESLDFQLDHARAIDAVHKALDIEALYQQVTSETELQQVFPTDPFVVNSKARDRMEYLQRPDLGRQLNEHSWQTLLDHSSHVQEGYDLAVVVADGLSSKAIQNHATNFLTKLLSKLANDENHNWTFAPLTIVSQGRVAVGDDVGECLKAKITIILIGERPGLTSPDSMGLYMTWNPKRGALDSGRNCISNIRPEGLDYDEASEKAYYLIRESMRLNISGINLKDRSLDNDDQALDCDEDTHFLVAQRTPL
ncbi:ethanolamine ammonia-lyase subunit EutC [Vibrio sp. TH_r3]|uniref:ethanolamine ammonia-lyase subunit EutC n=1 Tax=Vibrio sp. TH_r3 TaxID=3082084 RepID=UPI0029554C06|nr:ethanolamine ammonia-lyase subunit EutC [Vibrio sp. TH_r3]MDV7103274.1 ethanolamine ammonia-lyase subunit EutC [Vibrio sp. TH_r3]